MINYLNYILSTLQTTYMFPPNDFLCTQVNIYKKYWRKYYRDISFSFSYNSVPELYERHCFLLPHNEKVTISWDIKKVYQIASTSVDIKLFSLDAFEKIAKKDIENTSKELEQINKKVSSLHSHIYTPILVMNFKPMECFIILDGRHRYMEYKKLKPNSLSLYTY